MEATLDLELNYNDTNVSLMFSRYEADKTIALIMNDEDKGGCYMKITTCLDLSEKDKKEANFDINKHICVKTWGENEGIDSWLKSNGIAIPTTGSIEMEYPSHKLSVPIFELIRKPEDFKNIIEVAPKPVNRNN